MGYRTYTCPIAKSCGGCEWLAVPYPIQLERKQALVEEVLGQAVRRDGATLEKICGMDEPRGYRHKAATPFAPGSHGRVRCGFYAAGSHRIVPCSSCLVEAPGARDVLNAVARAAERCKISAYQEDRGNGILRHAVVRMGYATRECLLTIVTNGPRLPRAEKFLTDILRNQPQVTSVVQNINERRTNAILGRACVTLHGPGVMHDQLLGCSFEIGPTSFYQTNPAQTEVLYRLAIAGADLAPGMRLLDAYCGTGTIGLCLAHAAEAQGINLLLTGVDQVENNIQMARRNARNNKLEAEFICDDATRYMQALAKDGQNFDVIILDPPRAGSTPTFLKATAQLAQEKIVYVSCNVVTQARDLKVLLDSGFAIERVTPVDMFPHTKHVECVVVLSRV